LGIIRLEKVEFVEYYMKARLQAFTERNIMDGWRGSGLSPLNSFKVFRHLTDLDFSASQELSPTSTNSDLDHNILNKLETPLTVFDLQQFTKQLADLAVQDAINSPWRRAIPKLMQETEKVLTENIIMKKQLEDTEATLAVRQKRKTGKRAILSGVAHVSSKEMLDLLTQCEKGTKSKRRTRSHKDDNIEIEETLDDVNEAPIILDEIRVEY
jgi:hypothetical protein